LALEEESAEPAPTAAPLPTATVIAAGSVLAPTSTHQPFALALADAPAASVESADSAPATVSSDGGSGGLLWGAAALAAVASATAYALNRRKAREAEIEKMRREAAESASPEAFARRLGSLRARAEAAIEPLRRQILAARATAAAAAASVVAAAAATQAALELARRRAAEARQLRAEELRLGREERWEQAERRATLEASAPDRTVAPASSVDAWQQIELQRAREYAGYTAPTRPSLLRDPLGWVQSNVINLGRSNETARGFLTSAAMAWDQLAAPIVQGAGEFAVGLSYQTLKNNVEPAGWVSMLIAPRLFGDLPERVADFEAGFPDTPAFHAGRLFGGLVGLAETVALWGKGVADVGGGLVICGTGVLCGAGAPAIGLGSLEIAAGLAVAVASLHGITETFTISRTGVSKNSADGQSLTRLSTIRKPWGALWSQIIGPLRMMQTAIKVLAMFHRQRSVE
jgi:hypothetical protein